jgi:hypothetical protein
MKKIMQMALVCLLAMSSVAYAGDNRKCNKSGADKTCSAACQAACKKTECNKTCGSGCNSACAKGKCGTKKN